MHTETDAVVPVEADPHWGFRFFDSSQVARAPDLEDPTSGVLEQLSFVESQEELPIAHLPPADPIQGISRETSAWSLSGPPSAQHLRPARLRASFLRSWVVRRVSSRLGVHGERLRVGEGGFGRHVRGHLRPRRHRQRLVVLLEEAEHSVAPEGHCGAGDSWPLPAGGSPPALLCHDQVGSAPRHAPGATQRMLTAQRKPEVLRRPARSGRTSCGPRSRRGGDRAIALSGRSYPANPWRTSR